LPGDSRIQNLDFRDLEHHQVLAIVWEEVAFMEALEG
jgi:hypothetical protein